MVSKYMNNSRTFLDTVTVNGKTINQLIRQVSHHLHGFSTIWGGWPLGFLPSFTTYLPIFTSLLNNASQVTDAITTVELDFEGQLTGLIHPKFASVFLQENVLKLQNLPRIFCGLKSVSTPDDPWHMSASSLQHKRLNLPVYTKWKRQV